MHRDNLNLFAANKTGIETDLISIGDLAYKSNNILYYGTYFATSDGKYYANVHRLEGFPKKHWTYTILTKNNNFYAGGVLVHSEIEE